MKYKALVLITCWVGIVLGRLVKYYTQGNIGIDTVLLQGLTFIILIIIMIKDYKN